MTTLVWPSEAISKTVLDTLTGPGGPFELREEEVLGARDARVRATGRARSSSCCTSAAERHGRQALRDLPRAASTRSRRSCSRSPRSPPRCATSTASGRVTASRSSRPTRSSTRSRSGRRSRSAASTVGLNGWWTGEEIAYAVELTEPKVLLGDRRRLERLEGVELPDDLPVLSFEDDFAALEAYAPDAPFPEVELDEDDPFVILFTSGTTGRPKGVMLSHRNNIHFLLASMLNGAAAVDDRRRAGHPDAARRRRSR